ncbi:PEGA domain-containing protein [Porticoccus sp.]|uniref:PEGA domain-containing protein n=1 Tax=Porticoccus sp. TaxID=2024853 RepID=UPI003F69A180
MTDHRQQPQAIEPATFVPLGETAASRRFTIKPLTGIIAAGLLVSGLTLGFLFTAKSVVVQINPASADISISGGITFKLADHYLIRPGDYRINATAEGYLPFQQAFSVGPDKHQLLELAMAKKPGHLELTSTPTGAAVLVNGESVGKTPLTVRDLPPGDHQLVVQALRYSPVEETVTIVGLDRTQSLAVTLQQAWGQIELSSRPSGAEVIVDGESRGRTPLTTELLAAGEDVLVQLEGFKTWQKKLRVGVGETLTLPEIIFEPADATVSVTSSPNGATVTVKGTYRGVTPLDLALPPDQAHQLSFFANGYVTRKQALTLSAGEKRQLSITLNASMGKIQVAATPGDATVWIDGVSKGKPGQTFSLPARAHRIEIRKPGYATETRTITPKPGLDQLVQVTLLTEEAARWANTPTSITSKAGQSLTLFRPEDSFTMGAPRRETGRRANEVLREVRLTRPFYLATKEVTNQQFKQFSRQHSSSHVRGTTLDQPEQPVVNVSWDQTARYCNWLSARENLAPFYTESGGKITGTNPTANGYRLPTEAEWAWAARATSGGAKRFGWGQQFPPADGAGNFADSSASRMADQVITGYNDGFAVSAPVGSFSPNHRGLYDLEGNVAEWVNDYYGIEFSLGTGAEKDPGGPASGEFRVIRGASWRHGNIIQLRLSYRDYGLDGRDDLGFRVARSVGR